MPADQTKLQLFQLGYKRSTGSGLSAEDAAKERNLRQKAQLDDDIDSQRDADRERARQERGAPSADDDSI